MEFNQVRYFLALCETLNFTRAAEKCNVTQPSLTRAIRMLEEELGGPLFHRERSRSHLTELGRMMRPYLEQVHQQALAAKVRAKDFVKLRETPLRIGVMCTIAPGGLIGLFGSFQTEHPGVELYLRDAPAAVLLDQLLHGELDLAICGQPDPYGEELHEFALYSERFVIAVAPGHRFEQLNAVTAQDLHGERYLSRVNCEYGDYMRSIYAERGIELIRPYRSERDDWIQAMILAGLGFGFLPERSVTFPGIVTRELTEPTVIRTITLLTVRGRPHSPALGAFVRQATRFRRQAGLQSAA